MWELMTEKRTTEDGFDYTAYGIRQGSVQIADICVGKAEIDRLLDLLNRNNVSEINVADIVEDYVAEI